LLALAAGLAVLVLDAPVAAEVAHNLAAALAT